MKNRAKTIICDIDGTISFHSGDITTIHKGRLQILPGAKEQFTEWDRRGYNIILLTGRRESYRDATERQLSDAGIFYDQLVMGVNNGQRVLINDMKPKSTEPTAVAVNLVRNQGMKAVNV
jgi:hydroxymethylpyrimidine pyrophosphatase-like HAD family hydrolase